MANGDFVHLHVHTEFSMLDGAAKHESLFAVASDLKMPAVAMTDHGHVFGAYDFWKRSQDFPIKPIIGIEAYVAPSTRLSHKPEFWATSTAGQRDGEDVEGGKDVSGGGAYTHMTLLASNSLGLRNLFRLSSMASYEGFYRKARIDRELLATYGEGLIGTTGCVSGEVQTRLRLGQYDEARKAAAAYRDILGPENYYLELMDHGISIERVVRDDLLRLGKDLGLPLLATNDSHYVTKDQHDMHDNLLCVQAGGRKNDPKRFKFDGDGYYLKSSEEMRTLWRELPEACDNTLAIAERVEDYGEVFAHHNRMPDFSVPQGHTQESWFREEVTRGLALRFPEGVPDEHRKQADYEIDVIVGKGYPSYFLVVADFINWAKRQGIRVGPGRGCLTGDTPVITGRGTVALRDVRVGDIVRSHTGAMRGVSATHRYECDEELLHLRTYYDDRAGVTLTGGHKVWAEKAARESGKREVAQGIRWGDPTGDMGWVRADELEVGDLLAMPRPQGPWVDVDVIDLAQYADDRCDVGDEWIIESHATNRPFKYSIRDVHRATGVTRNALRAMLHPQRISYASTQNKVMAYVGSSFGSLDEWAEYVLEHQTIQSKIPRYLRVDEDFCRLMGMLAANGWLRVDDPAEVGVATRRSADDALSLRSFEAVWGLTPSVATSNRTDLTQYRIQSRVARAFYADQWRGYEYRAQSKSLPAWMLNLPEGKRRALLEGLWWGDGSHGSKSTYSTTSAMLRDAVRHLLLSLGLPAGVRHEARTDSRPEWPDHASWTITTTPNFGSMARQHGWSDDTHVYLRLREISSAPAEPVYDITVDADHSYTTSSFAVHNSGAGSMCAYAMGITDLDPIHHGLIFERFLNPERPSMPDFDIDFDERRRIEVIRYVTEKYGTEHASMVVTFGKIKAKQAVKDSTKLLGHPYSLGERINKTLPPDSQGKGVPLKDVFNPDHPRFDEGAETRDLYEKEPEAREVIDAAQGLEGLIRQTGVHAAAVILSSEPLLDVIPMHRRKVDGVLITGFDYPSCENMGLVKMDFLGLKNLTTCDDAVKMIEQNRGIEVDLDELTKDPTDPEVFRLLARGDTLGVFQLDGGGMRTLLRQMQPDTFEDISAALALYRPGPMGVNAHTNFALRKNGLQTPTPLDPALEGKLQQKMVDALDPILGMTHGLCIYQEQVQQIAQQLAGYTLGNADLLRRAMGKKKKEVLDAEYVPFSNGMKANGFNEASVAALWGVLIPFADYAFNKAHTAAYGIISYWTAYLKTHYPTEYMAALLTSVKDEHDKLAIYLNECRRMGIKVLPPDVNDSALDFTAAGDDIRFGLTAVRNVGAGVVTAIRVEREGAGPYATFENFIRRVPSGACNKKVIESLIKAGAFDSLDHPRQGLVAVHEKVIEAASPDKKAALVGQESLFDEPAPEQEIPDIEWDRRTLLAFEREMLGLYVSDHPLNGIEDRLSQFTETTIIDILANDNLQNRAEVTMAGLTTSVEVKRSKKGDLWAVVMLEDITGSTEVLVFPKTYAKVGHLLAPDSVCWISAKVMDKGDSIAFAADDIRPLDDLMAEAG